jgi:transposase-like protein
MKTSTKERKRHLSAAAKAKVLREYARREESQEAFCRRRGLAVSTLQNWRRRERASGFIELKPPAGVVATETGLVVEMPDRITVKVAEGLDPHWLGQVIAALRCGA